MLNFIKVNQHGNYTDFEAALVCTGDQSLVLEMRLTLVHDPRNPSALPANYVTFYLGDDAERNQICTVREVCLTPAQVRALLPAKFLMQHYQPATN